VTSTLTIGGDLTVNRLGFGAMRLTGKGVWGPPADRDECIRVLRRAAELGVDFIDTANSYGPYVSEELIREALGRLMRGRTVMAIAHRLSTVRNFDRILVLEKGRLVQDGSPETLLRCDGIYRKLIEAEMSRLANAHPLAA